MNRMIGALCLVLASACISPVFAGEIHVVVNKNAGVSKLDEREIKNIFMARRDTFPNGKNVIPLDRSASSDVYESFYSQVLRKNLAELNAYWSRKMFTGSGMPPRQIASGEEIVRLVSENVAYIGYVEDGVALDGVKVVYSTSSL